MSPHAPATVASPPATVTEAARHDLDLLRRLILADLRGRYAGSALGLVWSLVHPLVLVSIYVLVFSQLMGARLAGSPGPYEYGVFLCAGFIPWVGFSEIVGRSATVFLDHAGLVRHVAFRRWLLHGSVAGVAVVNTALLALALLVFLLALGRPIPAAVWAWPPLLLLQLAFGGGLGLFVSALNVFFRDVAQIVNVVLQLWFWLTPIVYPPSVLPPFARGLLVLNPLAHFTRVQQGLLVDGRLPGGGDLALLVLLPAAALGAGVLFLRAVGRRIPDEL